jgi:hypothetical protein
LSQDSYGIAFHALNEAHKSCVSVNNSSKSPTEAGTSGAHGQLSIEEDTQSRNMGKSNKKKNPTKKKKVCCFYKVDFYSFVYFSVMTSLLDCR